MGSLRSHWGETNGRRHTSEKNWWIIRPIGFPILFNFLMAMLVAIDRSFPMKNRYWVLSPFSTTQLQRKVRLGPARGPDFSSLASARSSKCFMNLQLPSRWQAVLGVFEFHETRLTKQTVCKNKPALVNNASVSFGNVVTSFVPHRNFNKCQIYLRISICFV